MAAAHVDPALALRRRALRRDEGRRRLAVLLGAIAIVLLPLSSLCFDRISAVQ